MFKTRSDKKELMDGETNPLILKQNYKEIEKVNKLLGGYATLIKGVSSLAAKNATNTILDIGCGSGDNINALLQWAKKSHISIDIIGLDYNETACSMANKAFLNNDNVSIICMDYRLYQPAQKIDIVCTSLFNHHLSDKENIEFIQWAGNISTKGFVINDLHRHPLAYYPIKWISVLANTSKYFRNDAPLSVLRAFVRNDWKEYAKETNLPLQISWQWAFRWLIIYRK